MFLGENVLKVCSSDNVWKGQVRFEKCVFDPLNTRGSEGVLEGYTYKVGFFGVGNKYGRRKLEIKCFVTFL